LLVIVRQKGAACHTQRKSCFFTSVVDGSELEIMAPIE